MECLGNGFRFHPGTQYRDPTVWHRHSLAVDQHITDLIPTGHDVDLISLYLYIYIYAMTFQQVTIKGLLSLKPEEACLNFKVSTCWFCLF